MTDRPLRIRRPPLVDGPYDDEIGEPVPPPTDGALALALPGLDHPAPTVPLRLVPPASAPDEAGPCPPLRPLVVRIAQAITEILAGGRSPYQLADHATYEVLAQLERWAGRLNGRRPGAAQPRVTSVHVSEPTRRAAEVCVVFDTGVRRRALALRLEAPGSRWRCTALQIG
jgi:hypothetical protein